jgi:multidrug efflux pump subunit AcrA (membrane-fusion protein)
MIMQFPNRTYPLLVAAFAVGSASLAQAQGPGPTTVAVTSVTEHEIPPAIRLVGTIRADRSSVVAAEVGGIVDALDADDGDFLSAGDVIAKLDPAVAKLRVDEAKAVLAGLEAQRAELENGTRPEEITRLKAVVAEAEAIEQKWAREDQRMQALYERGQCSDKERFDTEMDYVAAKRRLAQARAELEQAENGARVEEIARAREGVAAQRAVVQRLERNLDKTSIRAPFAGAIVGRHTELGEWIDEGGAVCEMIALDTVRVRVDVPERAIPFARAGAPATIAIEALDQTRNASITRVIPQASATARTFPVEIDVPNADHELLPGMFVWAYVPAGPTGKRLMVDRDAVVPRGTSKFVYVVRDGPQGGQMAQELAVETGLERDGVIEVRGRGLTVGDLVVTRANERLRDGAPVVINGNTPPPTVPPAAADDAATSSAPSVAARSGDEPKE